jgi:hypothetical protein
VNETERRLLVFKKLFGIKKNKDEEIHPNIVSEESPPDQPENECASDDDEDQYGAIVSAKRLSAMGKDELIRFAWGDLNKTGFHRYHPIKSADNIFLVYKIYRDAHEEFFGIAAKLLKSAHPLDARSWIAVALRHGEGQDLLNELEPNLLHLLHSRDAREMEGRDEESRRLNDSSYDSYYTADWLLFDHSESTRQYLMEMYANRITNKGRLNLFNAFLDGRLDCLGISHTESVKKLAGIGWDTNDLLLGFASTNMRMYVPPVDSHAVAALVEEHPKDALWLCDKKNMESVFRDYHIGRVEDMRFAWIDYLFKYCAYHDCTLLEKGKNDKSRKFKNFCIELLSDIHNPDFLIKQFEKNLQEAGVLHSTEVRPDKEDKKFEKKCRAALISAYTSHYLWDGDDFQRSFSDLEDIRNSLLWGIYVNDKLIQAFIYQENSPVDESGAAIVLKPGDKLGIVHAIELNADQRKSWKQRFKGSKQAIPQLSTPIGEIAEGDMEGKIIKKYFGAVSKHITIVGTAGKWGLTGNDNNGVFRSYHLLDPVHMIGAQISFDRFWSGPEYNSDDEVIRDAVFYRMHPRGFQYGDIIPESAILHPNEVSKRFVSTAIAVFDSISGVK